MSGFNEEQKIDKRTSIFILGQSSTSLPVQWLKSKKTVTDIDHSLGPPQSAQSARLSSRHILENRKIGGIFEEIWDGRLWKWCVCVCSLLWKAGWEIIA